MSSIDVQLPPGRFVSGSITERQTTDQERKPIPVENQTFDFGMAFDKFNPDGSPGAIWTAVHQIANHAKTGYAQHPAIVQRIDQWLQTMAGGFSMKMSDGDKPSARTGEVNPNYAGKLLLWFSTKLPVRVCDANNIQIDPNSVKRGWFFDMTISTQINGRTDGNAGVYLNSEWLRLVGEGAEITGGRSADAAFGGAPAAGALPPGATPVGSTPAAPAGAPATGLPGGAMPAVPAQPAMATPGLPAAGNAPQPATMAPAVPQAAAVAGSGTANPGAVATGVPAIASPSNPAPVQHPPHPGIMPGQAAPVAQAAPAVPAMPGAVPGMPG